MIYSDFLHLTVMSGFDKPTTTFLNPTAQEKIIMIGKIREEKRDRVNDSLDV